MVIGTKYLTVRIEDVSGVGKNDGASIFVVYKSGTMQTLQYAEGDNQRDADFNRLDAALRSKPDLEVVDK